LEDVAFRVIAANQAPDHATVARFRARHEIAIGELFGQVLALCAQAGLVRLGVVAVDGTKIAANATHHATRSSEQIAREILEQAAALDAAEDERYGDARGDELPVELRVGGDRRKRLREAKQALDAEREANAEPVARDRGQRLRECRRRLEQDYDLERRLIAEHDDWLAAGIASDGSRRMTGARHNIKPYPLGELAERAINVTDPDARNLKTPRGWVQGYNAQAAVTAEQIMSRPRSAPSHSTRRTWTRCSPPPKRNCTPRASPTRSTSFSPTRATGRTARSRACPVAASNRWSPPTRTVAKTLARAVAAGSMTSCAASWHRTRSGALPPPPSDRRAGLRPDQSQPRR
jgi:hypothetical protein